MLTNNIKFKNFSIKKKKSNTLKIYKKLISNYHSDNKKQILKSLSKNYQYSFNKKSISKYKKLNNFRIIGMGGSILGAEAIYNFLKKKIKKNFYFLNNLQSFNKSSLSNNQDLNIVISKSGNTLETIANSNIFIKKNQKSIFILENKNSYLKKIAEKLKAEVIEHNNFIGGRYSVLSEVGMLPAELMGLDEGKFKQLNSLIKNKNFFKNLINNVDATLSLIKKKKYSSVILNYDENSESLFKWYQQLIGESLGKKSKGLLPVISNMPKDNHSLMQFYLDGPQKNFYTFFNVLENNKDIMKIKSERIIKSHAYLKNKSLQEILNAQKKATEKVFISKKLPFRSFEIIKRNEETMGQLFSFFIIETILLGKLLKVNPFDQPSVELIKTETKKIFK